MIISGFKNTLIVKDDGTVITWGNASRFTGSEMADDESKSAVVAGLKNVKSIAAAAGCYGSYALQSDGTVWAWGWNVFRHLGTGSTEEYVLIPEKVNGLSDAVAITAGVSHAIALLKDGTMRAWGKNWYGQLGCGIDPKAVDSFPPTKISDLHNVTQISSGFFHSLALTEDGTVWRWGGYGDSTFQFPIVYAANKPTEIKVPGKVISISAGGMHDVMLCEDGTVWTCGYNTLRQLGVQNVANEVIDTPVHIERLSGIKAISAGGGFTLALTKDGTVWAWGTNGNGELGNGSYDTKVDLSIDDHMQNEPGVVSMVKDVVEIAAGGSHAMAISRDGTIWVWGNNDEGQLGNFTESKLCIPQRLTIADSIIL